MMSDDYTDGVPSPGRILFGCGIVLGVCLGFAAGHFTLWGRINRSDDFAQNPFQVDDSLHGQSPSHLNPERPTAAVGPEVPRSDSVPGPFFAAAARRLMGPTEEESLSAHPVRVATDITPRATASTPDSLSFSDAAPIDEETQLREQVTRTIIAQELPHSTEQEQEIWFDVLRGMEAADVKGILRMRKHVGGDPASTFGMLQIGPDVSAPPAPKRSSITSAADEDRWKNTLQSLQQIRDIRMHNLANAETIGFIRQLPVTRELTGQTGHSGVQFLKSELDPSAGVPFHTGRLLDVAISGTGFFQVRYQDEVRLTRCGRFLLDEERHLGLSTTSEPWRLEPPIVVPEDVVEVLFNPGGQVDGIKSETQEQVELGRIQLVTVDAPAALEPVGEGLYAVTELSGPIRPQASGGQLHGRSVERMSDQIREAEMNSLERVLLLMSQMVTDSSPK
ncbi:MAG: hypothetical protein KDA52_10350 [Planctomycetaceae bacterium]|nr:hypothetical protein [Planctomycetaceae bacterium]